MVETVPAIVWWCAAVVGLLAVAILEANNVRDIATDAVAGKRTLAVRIGDARARALYAGLVIGAAFVTIVARRPRLPGVAGAPGSTQWGLFGLAAWPLAITAARGLAHGDGARADPGARRHGEAARGDRRCCSRSASCWRTTVS